MAQIIYDIDNAVLPRVTDALLYLFPNNEREVKDGVDPVDIPDDTPMSDDTYYQDKYTDNQWLKEIYRREMIQDIKRSEQKQAQDAVAVPKDDTLVT